MPAASCHAWRGEPGCICLGAPPGTQVIVTDLFYNTPARQKFLKSPVAEGGRVRSLVTRLALAAPHVAFRLTQDDRIVIETPGNNSADDTVLALYGREVVSQLFPVAGQGQPVSLRGLISRPQLTRNNRRDQVFVINGRLVECRSLSAVVQEAYRSLLPRGRHPLAFLHLDLQPERVDVNVHPAKIEVRLQEERQVAAVVLRTLREALSQAAAADPAASVGPRATFSVPTQQPQRPLAASPSPVQDESPATQRPLPEVPISLYRNKQEAAAARVAEQEQKEPVEIVTPPPTTAPYRVLGQALQSYIIIEKEDGLQIVDQHAAHERIIYEELLQQTDTAVAPLLLPYTLEVTAREAAVLEHAQAELCALGFTVEHFGGRTWTLRSIPNIHRARFRPEDFLDLVADWAEAGWQKPDKKREQICISLACRGAIKAGQKLHPAEMVELLDRLWHTELPYTCPHGRPIAISFSAQQLFNLFHP